MFVQFEIDMTSDDSDGLLSATKYTIALVENSTSNLMDDVFCIATTLNTSTGLLKLMLRCMLDQSAIYFSLPSFH